MDSGIFKDAHLSEILSICLEKAVTVYPAKPNLSISTPLPTNIPKQPSLQNPAYHPDTNF